MTFSLLQCKSYDKHARNGKNQVYLDEKIVRWPSVFLFSIISGLSIVVNLWNIVYSYNGPGLTLYSIDTHLDASTTDSF